MGKLIDAEQMKAEELGAFISAQAQTTDSVRRGIQEIVHTMLNQLIDDAPAADAEPVVRCKDCKFFSMTTLGMPYGACWHRADEINGLSGEDEGYTVCHRVDSPDFFCAWGERGSR